MAALCRHGAEVQASDTRDSLNPLRERWSHQGMTATDLK
ncbi:hypothetical protein ATN83_p20090 (plasmid) [Raoultella ornithinolytica]|uniref:Uncharacterized protein n=2 Tax=Klebsiella TaxID=570 RepID=A0A286NCA4_KLEPN|nr:hypothetical protein ATN83_p20090 [Raoultella ornithinolytica]ASY91237.1 hypothetical protein [Klebsiella pneumoniae]AVX33817.1 Hypothetical protein [Klebsiella aerogenes]AVX34372.1 hypothetical protein [Klebsiella pneumoniae]AWF77194.1 hypothetical protein [Klebsiella pneumoniae]